MLSFTAAENYPVGAGPQEVVTVDFNKDGKLDVATANVGSNNVTVRLGNGAGGFGAAVDFPTGAGPNCMTVGDFNNDTKPDLVTGSQTTGKVSVLLGNGNGAFGAPIHTDVGGEPLSIAVGDLGQDGTMDLLVGARYRDSYGEYDDTGEVAVLVGNNTGSFFAGGWYGTGYGMPTDIAVVDLNGDSILDIVTNWDADAGAITVFIRPVTDWFPAFYDTGAHPQALALGDFTGDGKLDVITAGDTIDVLPGNGQGAFGAPINQPLGDGPYTSVATGDFNGDGKLDAVVTDGDTGTVSIMLGNGDGTLRYAGAFATGASPTAVAVTDFNGDGRPDVVSANGGSNNVSVLLNDGVWGAIPPSLRIGDATVTEGNSGSVNVTCTVSLSQSTNFDVTVQYHTADITATADSDYGAASGTVVIPAGQTSQTFTVAVRGDRLAEPTERFGIDLSAPTNATISDAQGFCTIVDNEPRVSINSVSKKEGNGGTISFSFTVTLLAAYDQAVTVNYATAAGTATAGSNYQSKSGTITFAPGETVKTITVLILGDKRREANETFFVDLFGASSNALIGVTRGAGTILNDD